MKHIFAKSLAVGLAVTVLLSFARFTALCGEVRSSVVRLHLLANSDSETDQALKLKVRDAVLAASEGLLTGITDKEAAVEAVRERLPALRQAAADCVAREGYAYPVKAELEESYFTTRSYGDVTLPAGTYTALRITIGEGTGHNWWCVVFPPLCGAAAVEDVSGDFTADEIALITRQDTGYALKFRAVECWEALRQTLFPA